MTKATRPPATRNMAPRREAEVPRWHPESAKHRDHLGVLISGLAPFFGEDLRAAMEPINSPEIGGLVSHVQGCPGQAAAPLAGPQLLRVEDDPFRHTALPIEAP